MRKPTILLVGIVAVALVGAGCSSSGSSTPPRRTSTRASSPIPVPAQYQVLDRTLLGQVAAIHTGAPASGPSTAFGAELLTANANRGPALLAPGTLTQVERELRRDQTLGVKGVTISVNFPILDAGFPNQPQYQAFYGQVAQQIHQRGLTLAIETDDLFAGTVYSPLHYSYAGLTLSSYEAAKAAMAATVISTMHPAYLSIEGEADTEQYLTRLPLDNPGTYASVVSTELAQLGSHAGTLIGAGPGSWESTLFAQALARIPSLDYVDTHIYSTQASDLANVHAIAQIAHAAGKPCIMEEAWLQKAGGSDPLSAGVQGNQEAFLLNDMSFFAPLDQAFLTKLVALSRADGFAYVSPFSASAFSAYLTYPPAFTAQSFQETTQQYDTVVSQAMSNGQLSDTGRAYQQLIRA